MSEESVAPRKTWVTILKVFGIVAIGWFILLRGRSCSIARHEVPTVEASKGEVYLATFNGL